MILELLLLLLDPLAVSVGLQVEDDRAAFVAEIKRQVFIVAVVLVKYQYDVLVRACVKRLAQFNRDVRIDQFLVRAGFPRPKSHPRPPLLMHRSCVISSAPSPGCR